MDEKISNFGIPSQGDLDNQVKSAYKHNSFLKLS